MSESQGTMEMFLNRALQRILSDGNSKKLPRLRESCSTTLDLIQKIGVTPVNDTKEHLEQIDKVTNKLIITLKLACESKQPKIMSQALDCLQKLIAYGFIRPTIKDIEKPERRLIDKVMEIIGDCFDSPDDNVQLQIIKAFLTAVSSPASEIHDQALMIAIRACFNIYLVSRNKVNQATAKATLTQILSIIFQRFEQATIATQDGANKQQNQSNHQRVPSSSDVSVQNKESEGPEASEEKDKEKSSEIEEVPVSNNEEEKSGGLSETDSAPIPVPIENGLPVVEVPSGEIAIPQSVAKLNNVNTNLNIAYADCFLIFRALCKLSTKELASGASAESVDMRRKLLALELLQTIIDNAGPVVRKSERFINNAIKKYLFISLLLNGVSPFIRVFKTSLNIFYGLITNFKDNLKTEIGMFFTKILLRVLGSSNSSIQHKHGVLGLLHKICKQGQVLVDIFLNYDCHMDSVDVFERTVNELASIAKGSQMILQPNHQPIQTEIIVCTLALECLVTILRSLVQWSSELADDDKKSSSVNQSASNLYSNSNGPGSLIKTSTDGDIKEPELEKTFNKDTFTLQKHMKQQVEHGKKLFNYKPKSGIQYLIKIGHIKEETSKEVAKFLLFTEGLDRTMIGDYLGIISNPFCKSVLYDYVDLQRFENMEIYDALRQFLMGFRLPGEGQIIDVIMEKFAERYYNDNQKAENCIFRNADAVYIFAYHMIMLATDLHNPAIKRKITKPEWIKNNTGLNDGTDFPEGFLIHIYDTIAQFPLKVRDDDHVTAPTPAAPTNSDVMSPKQRQMLFHKESKMLVTKSQELILEKLQKKSIFFKSTNIEHVKPMFEMCWCPMLAAFSMILEKSQDSDKEIFTLCLEGFRCAIRVSSIFYMETERNAFVSSLSQFTLLSNLREMKLKNLEAIKCLIQIANENGNYLQQSWIQVLNCISQLAKIFIFGSNKSINQTTGGVSDDFSNIQSQSTTKNLEELGKYLDINAISVVESIDVNEIEKIFSNTVHLNDNAIVEFVDCLCKTSLSEVNSGPEPRIFSLQKLIEIAYYNMERIRFVWTRIWGIMANHFQTIGCHDNQRIAMYAVDSLRQLSMKFLEKDELANYNFQKDFLKPFEFIILENNKLPIRELVVRCLSQMIQARAINIKSGWKCIFTVFTLVAMDNDQSIIQLAYEMIEKIVNHYFHLISSSFFVEFIDCLISFSNNLYFKEICIRSIESINFCAQQLYSGRVIPRKKNDEVTEEDSTATESASSLDDKKSSDESAVENADSKKQEEEESSTENIVFTTAEQHLFYWLPILQGLSKIILHPNIDVRTSAIDHLFNILLKFGDRFHESLLTLIFKEVLFPIFDSVRSLNELINSKNQKDTQLIKQTSDWLTSSCLNAFSHLLELFSYYFHRISFLYEYFLLLISNCILQENFQLSQIGSSCLLQFIISNGAHWSPLNWLHISQAIHFVILNNRCVELLNVGERKKPGEANPEKQEVEEKENAQDAKSLCTDIENESFENKLKRTTAKKYHPYDVKVITGKCNVQLHLLTILQQLFATHSSSLSAEHFTILFSALDAAYSFATSTTSNQQTWKATGKSEIMPLMIKQENSSASILLDILFKLYADPSDERKKLAESRLMNFIEKLLREYLFLENNNSLYPPIYSASKVPIVLQVLNGYLRLENSQFMKHLSRFYELFSNLVLVTIVDIRNQVRQLFIHIGKLNGFLPTPVAPEQPAVNSRELDIQQAPQLNVQEAEPPKQPSEPQTPIEPPVESREVPLPAVIEEPATKITIEPSQPAPEVAPEAVSEPEAIPVAPVEAVAEPVDVPEVPIVAPVVEEVKEEQEEVVEPETKEEEEVHNTETVINEEASHTLNGTHESVNDPEDTIENKETHTFANGESSVDQPAPEEVEIEDKSQEILDAPLAEEIQIEN